MKTIGWLLAAAILLPRVGAAQALTREAEMSGGNSSEDVQAGGVQARVFGTVAGGWRVYPGGVLGRNHSVCIGCVWCRVPVRPATSPDGTLRGKNRSDREPAGRHSSWPLSCPIRHL